MLRMVRGGGIFEENDGGDRWQDSEWSEICNVRIPSVSFADSVPTPIGPSGHFPLIGGIGPLSPRGAMGKRSPQNREQELLVFLGVHIFPRDKDAGDLDEIVGLLTVCDADGLLDGHVAHVERPLRDDGLNDVLL